MKKSQELYKTILNLILDFKEPFTFEELYKTLREKRFWLTKTRNK